MDKFSPKDAEKFTHKATNEYARDLWAQKANESAKTKPAGEAIRDANRAVRRYKVG